MSIDSVLRGLERLKMNMEYTKSMFESLPAYIRYYAISDFKSGTGMDFNEWINEVNNMLRMVEAMKTSPSKDYATILEKFSNSLLRLINYVKGLKQKIDYLPPGLIPNINEIVEKFSSTAVELESLRGEIDNLRKLL
ncbi:MAG: hypothetical protein QXI93_03725 [Candidatus Methanomethylicia archaeon]